MDKSWTHSGVLWIGLEGNGAQNDRDDKAE